MEKFEILASLFGYDVSKGSKNKTSSDEFVFKDPSEYEHMSDEEKKRETEEAMSKLKKQFSPKEKPVF